MKVEVAIPPNTGATVRLRGTELDGVRVDGELLRVGEGEGVLKMQQDGEDVVVEVGSGAYGFEYEIQR